MFVFSFITMPFLIFYGPFEEVKRVVTGATWNTLTHHSITRFFLSEEKIKEILSRSYAVDPTENGEALQILNFGSKETEKIEYYDIKGSGFRGKLLVVHQPQSIVVGYSENLPKSGSTTSEIAIKNGAIAAINAGGFIDEKSVGTGGNPMGFIIHDGEVVYNQCGDENIPQDTVAFTDKGVLIVGKHSISKLKGYKVKEGVSFGPPLIVNGNPTITEGDGGWGIAPRTAIGQRKTGEVLMLVIDGRNLGSLGATLKEVQDILLKFGAVNAANLDGGSSTTMFFNGKVVNRPSDKLGERTVPSVFMVVPNK
ncbi:MAG TPA: exopolysaccharide biosynthesis protein [Clostridiaceae bacterium]|nr:exopolysaccharide biosynthesis protein [Clostridiaceae bacterium]